MVEELLQTLVGVVDTQLLERVVLHTTQQQQVNYALLYVRLFVRYVIIK